MSEEHQRLSDQQVGEALRRLRGGQSQQELALLMRASGWKKWSQSTVWSVEKGDRPLRLLEAADLADILGVQVEEFYALDDHGVLDAARRLDGDLSRLAGAMIAAERRHQRLVDVLSGRPAEAEVPVPEWVLYLAGLDPEELWGPGGPAAVMKAGGVFPSVELGWGRDFGNQGSTPRGEPGDQVALDG